MYMRSSAAVLITATVSDGLLTKLQNSESERSSACRDRNKEVRPHYSSASSTPLASGTAANYLQEGDDRLQMPSWSGAVLPS